MVQESFAGAKMSESESEERKWSKPIMEKRRRERINQSLDELKRLVLEAQNRDSSRYTKLEKADILEMTVNHLRGLRSRRKNATTMASQGFIPTGMNIGCYRSLVDVGHCVIPDHVMKTRKRTQTMAHLVGISTIPRDRMYMTDTPPVTNGIARDREFTSGIPGLVSQGVVAQSQTCQPLHGNTAVQFIPICSSQLSNSNVFPGTHIESCEPYCLHNYGEHFWRPF